MLEVRDFVLADREIYLDMSRRFYSGDAALNPVGVKNFEDTFTQLMQGTPYVRGLMLTDKNEIVGYALLAMYWSCEAGGMCVWLDELFLSEVCRGKGYGTQFIQWLTAEYKSTAKRLRLEVCPRNSRVKRLYEQCGYQELEYIQMIKEL